MLTETGKMHSMTSLQGSYIWRTEGLLSNRNRKIIFDEFGSDL